MAMRERARLQLVVQIGGEVVDHALAGAHPAIGHRDLDEAGQSVGEKAAGRGNDDERGGNASFVRTGDAQRREPFRRASATERRIDKKLERPRLHDRETGRDKTQRDKQREAAPLPKDISAGVAVVPRNAGRRLASAHSAASAATSGETAFT